MRQEVYIHIKQPTSCSAWRKRSSKTVEQLRFIFTMLYRLSRRVVTTITTSPQSTTIIFIFISHNNQSVGNLIHQPKNQPVRINNKWSFSTPLHWSSYFTLSLSTLSLQKWYKTKNVNYISQRHRQCTSRLVDLCGHCCALV